MASYWRTEVGCSEVAVHIYKCGDAVLESGSVLPNAWLAYETHGSLATDRSNAIVVPTHFGGTHETSTYLIGPGRALDPRKYFIILPNLIGNGLSVSPSNAVGIASSEFPLVTIRDNVSLQRQLVETELGVLRVQAVVGHSMGAIQAYHWAALCPDLTLRFAAICGCARTSEHARAFLTGMAAALTADASWNHGCYAAPPLLGLRAMALAWCAWPPSAHFYRQRLYRQLGYRSLEDFLERYWVQTFAGMDANNLLCQIRTWQEADISRNTLFAGDFPAALRAISAKGFVMPCNNDAYFPMEDCVSEVAAMPNAQLRVISSSWGHWAGSGRSADDLGFIDANLDELLQEESSKRTTSSVCSNKAAHAKPVGTGS
jgi:homoserine O-acetyltransferase/O-succinyltransferase